MSDRCQEEGYDEGGKKLWMCTKDAGHTGDCSFGSRLLLVEYRVRILAPGGYPPNEVMDEALRTLGASLEYRPTGGRTNLERLVDERFVRGVDSLGAAGFSVEVVRADEEEKS